MKVLVPIDDSNCCERTLQSVVKTMDKTTTEYYLLHVIPRPNIELMVEAYQIQDTVTMLEKAKRFLTGQGCKVASTEFEQGDPVSKICEYADALEADLIVMGSHGRTGLAKLFYGSISQGVLERSHKPVFFYKNLAPQAAHASS